MKRNEKLFLNLYIHFHFWVNFASLNQNESTYFSFILLVPSFQVFFLFFLSSMYTFWGTLRDCDCEISFFHNRHPKQLEREPYLVPYREWKNKKFTIQIFDINEIKIYLYNANRQRVLVERKSAFHRKFLFFPPLESSYYVKVENIGWYRKVESR